MAYVPVAQRQKPAVPLLTVKPSPKPSGYVPVAQRAKVPLLSTRTHQAPDFSQKVQLHQTMGNKSFVDYPGVKAPLDFSKLTGVIKPRRQMPFLPDTKLTAGEPTLTRKISTKLPNPLQRPFEEIIANLRDGLFGNQKDRAAVRDIEEQTGESPNLVTSLATEGMLPFLGRSQNDKVEHIAKKLEEKGVPRERAASIAFYDVFSRDGKPEDQKRQDAEKRLNDLKITGAEKRVLTFAHLGQVVGNIADVSNVVPVGSIGHAMRPTLIKQLVQAKSVEHVSEILRGAKVPDDLIKTYAPAFAKTSDKATIEKGIDSLIKTMESTKPTGYTPVSQRGAYKPVQERQNPLPDALTPYDTPEIIAARKEADAIPRTWNIQTLERNELRSKILNDFYGEGATTKGKRLDIVIGGPASGKSSSIVKPLAKEYGSLVTDSDDIKHVLPEYRNGIGANAVHNESAVLNRQIMDRALASGDNVVWPTIGRTDAHILKAIERFKKAGYEIHLHHVDLPLEESVPRLVQRFKETGRFVDPHYAYHEVGLRPRDVYAKMKGHEGLSSQSRFSTSGTRPGERPRLLEHSGKGRGGLPDSLRPLDGGGNTQESVRVRGAGDGRGVNGDLPPLPKIHTGAELGKTAPVESEKFGKTSISPAAKKLIEGRGTKDIGQLQRMLERTRESLKAAEADPEAHAKAYGGDRRPAYTAKIADLEKRIEASRTELRKEDPEIDSLEDMAQQHASSEFVLGKSMREGDRVTSNLEHLFNAMKGVDADDTSLRFTDEDLMQARAHYEIITDSLVDDPARALVKYRSKTTGRLPEVTGKEKMRSLTGSGKTVKTSEFGRRGDDIAINGLGFKDLDEAQEALDSYLKRREEAGEVLSQLREISHNIRLAKQRDTFVGANKRKLSKEASDNIRALRALAEAAERAGFKRGLSEGSKRYNTLVSRLRDRRTKINAIKRTYNLTDSQMKKVRGPKDPRFMDETEFENYLEEARGRADLEFKRDQEKLFIEEIINTKSLNKTENLQRALEFPPVRDMTLEQLIEFGGLLAKTDAHDTFLGPRMIQTAKNTDLGNIRTIGEGRQAIAKQTGMPYAGGVEGKKIDRWLRDPTLVDKDPLHKMFVTEWAAKEADMLTRQYALERELTALAKAARGARKQKGPKRSLRRSIFDVLTPWDENVVKWLQPFETTWIEDAKGKLKKRVIVSPEMRAQVQRFMTPEELKYAQFLEKFFSHYYDIAAKEATARWTLQGVKHSNYRSKKIESVYLPHMKRGFLERWRDDGFVRAIKILWDRNLADTKIDFNAFGDRGEVLGYEKWLKNNMERVGEGVEKETGKLLYSQNTAKVALAYFRGFERKLLLDAMTPKIKLLEFLMGKRFETPKSISNPEGTEKVHSQLSKHINEWINNKKGQRIEMVYAQGDRLESVVDASSLLVSLLDLGGNIITQTASAVGGELMTMRGAKFGGWALGHKRSLTKQGRRIGRAHAGVIGNPPWNALASAANDAGDTLVSGLFYIFGDLAYRARRQTFLGLLTKDEFATGVIAPKRQAEVKLAIGKWHPLPEFRSVGGSTSIAKATSKYMEWATPAFQTAVQDLAKLIKETKRFSNDEKKLHAFLNSEHFQNTMRTILVGSGAYVLGQLVFQPDKNDKSFFGQMRAKAARESSSIIQAITGVGIFVNVRMLGFMQELSNALITLARFEEYQTSGNGHEKGDLKGPPALGRALTPNAIKQFIPAEETKKTGGAGLPSLPKLPKLPELPKLPTLPSI